MGQQFNKQQHRVMRWQNRVEPGITATNIYCEQLLNE
jgi:hypothetical protein